MRIDRLIILLLCALLVGGIQVAGATTQVRDDFSNGLAHWETGKHPKTRSGKPVEVAVKEGQVVFPQHYEFIVTRDEVEGDFEFSFDVLSSGSTPQMANLWVQLTAAPELGGIFRFRYGMDARESINLGLPPMESSNPGQWDGLDDGDYLRDLTDISKPEQGRITFTYRGGKVRMSYTNDLGQMIETPFVATTAFDATRIKIWGNRGTAIDNVKLVVFKPEAVEPEVAEVTVTAETGDTNTSAEEGEYEGSGFVVVDGKKYPLRMGAAGTSSLDGINLTAMMISPDENPDPVVVNLNIMHSDPDDWSGVYQVLKEDKPGSLSGSVTVFPGREGREFSTYVYTEGRAEIKQENGGYKISFTGRGADAVGAGANHPPVYVDITYTYSGDLVTE